MAKDGRATAEKRRPDVALGYRTDVAPDPPGVGDLRRRRKPFRLHVELDIQDHRPTGGVDGVAELRRGIVLLSESAIKKAQL